MKTDKALQVDNIDLLMEIFTLKTKVNELYHQKGPGNPNYINLKIKLDLLINDYIDEKIISLKKYNDYCPSLSL